MEIKLAFTGTYIRQWCIHVLKEALNLKKGKENNKEPCLQAGSCAGIRLPTQMEVKITVDALHIIHNCQRVNDESY